MWRGVQHYKSSENIDICFFSTAGYKEDIDVEQMEEVFRVNFFGTWLYQSCWKILRKKNAI